MTDYFDDDRDPRDPSKAQEARGEAVNDDAELGIDAIDEALADDLVRLVAMHLEADPDSAPARDERLLQWQAAEARRRSEAADQDGSYRDRVSALARRIEAAAWSARLPVIRRKGEPPLRDQGDTPKIDLGVAAGTGRDLWDEPCDSWIELPEEMPAGRYLGLGVNGDSMEPLMHTGDTILVRVGPEVHLNTVIVARHPDDGYVVKRVDRVTPTAIHLASLNSGYPPVSIPRDPSLIVGTVVMRWCAHGEEAHSAG